MNRRIILLFSVLVVAAALIGITFSMSSFRGEIAPTPTPEDLTLAQVGDDAIKYQEWFTRYQLDLLMSELAGQPAPGARETLERMINAILVLRAYPPQHTPTHDEVREHIQALEAGWGLDDTALETRLREINMSYAQFEEMVADLLTLEIAQQLLIVDQDPAAWIAQARGEADVIVDESLLRSLPHFAKEITQP
ncbi:MAG: SurA N-terminal domain-containing protein [Anaerolineae bacterium]|nr:SurA N-terminal domain-containing protein [Anaerolineae bacterium]